MNVVVEGPVRHGLDEVDVERVPERAEGIAALCVAPVFFLVSLPEIFSIVKYPFVSGKVNIA